MTATLPPRAHDAASLAGAVRGLDTSPRLARRRYEELPVTGPGAIHTGLQGRGPGDSTTLDGLGELVSSIGVHGVLTPVLVEELPSATGPTMRLVTGEGRLRACRLGLTSDPANEHYQLLPALVCPGPLTDEERNAWQLIENLARNDYQPGELASALLLERCAVLAARLADHGIAVPVDELAETDDPVARWTMLEKVRIRQAPQVGAPWELVLRRLGVAFGPRKARQLVAAFQALPRELSTDLDAHKIALTTRTGLARLAKDPRASVTELWTAVKALGRPDLLAAATAAAAQAAAETAPGVALPPVEHALHAAVDLHTAANAARAEKLTHRPANGDHDETSTSTTDTLTNPDSPHRTNEGVEVPVAAEICPGTVTTVLNGLRELTAALRAGGRLPRYTHGSLALLLDEARNLLPATTNAESR